MRRLFGLAGEALADGALNPDAGRDAAAIGAYIDGLQGHLDVDGDGKVGALTDGLLLLRHLSGFSGNALTLGAASPNAGRDAEGIAAFIEQTLLVDVNQYRVEFLGERTRLLQNPGEPVRVEAGVHDPQGNELPDAELAWELSPPQQTFVLLHSDGHSATLLASSDTPDSALLTARYAPLGLEAKLPVAVVEFAGDTAVLDSDSVLQRTPTQTTAESYQLARNAQTESLQVGQALLAADAGILIRITDIQWDTLSIRVTGQPIPLTEAVDNLVIRDAETPSERLEIRYDGKRATVTRADGRVQVAAIEDFRCENTAGIAAPLTMAGAKMTFQPEIHTRGSLVIRDGVVEEFSIKAGMSLDIAATTGQIDLQTTAEAGTACTLALSGIESPGLPLSVFTVQLQVAPSVGFNFYALIDGPSLSINGPQGRLSGRAEAGICFADRTSFKGWYSCGDSEFSAEFQPPGAALSTGVDFHIRDTGPFARLDFNLLAGLGRPPILIPLAEFRFAAVTLAADLEFRFTSPFDPEDGAYTGPAWSLDARFKGEYKAELDARGVSKLIGRLGIPTSFSFSLQGEFLNRTQPLLASPRGELGLSCESDGCRIGPDYYSYGTLVDPYNGGRLGLTFTPEPKIGFDQGTLSLFAFPYSGAAPEELHSMAVALDAPVAWQWTPSIADTGAYGVQTRLKVDALSEKFPYQSSGGYVLVGKERYTKLDAAGDPLPYGAEEWFCVRDEESGLTWEIKLDPEKMPWSGFYYSWYDPDPATNGYLAYDESGNGNSDAWAGAPDRGACGDYLSCDTSGYVRTLNGLGQCGHNDWRMPTKDELAGLLDTELALARGRHVDPAYFWPNRISKPYWSASSVASTPLLAWAVDFEEGVPVLHRKQDDLRIMLVRGSP